MPNHYFKLYIKQNPINSRNRFLSCHFICSVAKMFIFSPNFTIFVLVVDTSYVGNLTIVLPLYQKCNRRV